MISTLQYSRMKLGMCLGSRKQYLNMPLKVWLETIGRYLQCRIQKNMLVLLQCHQRENVELYICDNVTLQCSVECKKTTGMERKYKVNLNAESANVQRTKNLNKWEALMRHRMPQKVKLSEGKLRSFSSKLSPSIHTGSPFNSVLWLMLSNDKIQSTAIQVVQAWLKLSSNTEQLCVFLHLSNTQT